MSGCHVHVVLNRRKESLQPFIRGGIRKIASEDLGMGELEKKTEMKTEKTVP